MADRLPWLRPAVDGPTGPLIRAVSSVCRPLAIGTPDAYDEVIDQIGDAPMVFLGEATHGTHEFYAIRQQITKRLIQEKGFRAIAIEGDWPDAAWVDVYLRTEAGAAETARERFACFEPIGNNMEVYAMLVNAGSIQSCAPEILRVLDELRQRRVADAEKSPDYAFFDAEQNVLATQAAESFYRAMLRGDPDSWNVRDCYMFETFQRLRQHLGAETRFVVWAHNTHVGDYSKTEEQQQGFLNIGQLTRAKYAEGWSTIRPTSISATTSKQTLPSSSTATSTSIDRAR